MANRPHYFRPEWVTPTTEALTADVIIYGGTAAGVIAAKALADRGRRVVILNPASALGGMSTGGLGWTDFGKKGVIGGMSLQFYRDLGTHYGDNEPRWVFEPKAAQAVMDTYAENDAITVRHRQFLASVEVADGRIVSATMLGGLVAKGAYFMDCTYEGDLFAKAGVSYHVGREANSVHGETINGVQMREKHQFSHPVDPYIVPGDPASGTLPWVNEADVAVAGSGDQRIQAYNFRMCMTDDPELKLPWTKPETYCDLDYELARRWFQSEKDGYNEATFNPDDDRVGRLLRKFDVIHNLPNGHVKTDTNNHGPASTDFIGANYAWPDASYAQREVIFQAHVDYMAGYFWFMANDPAVPERYRSVYANFGLAGDEFPETGGWPHQLYVREARRMVSDYALTEADTQHVRQPEDPIAMGSYAMDSHNCQRVVRDGRVLNEGDVQLPPKGPYGVSYRSIVPARAECQNLFVPVCIASSHIAFGSVRMEPVFMAMAESAAIAADLILDEATAVQDLPYTKLEEALQKAGQVVRYEGEEAA